jgi:hypothetical protein
LPGPARSGCPVCRSMSGWWRGRPGDRGATSGRQLGGSRQLRRRCGAHPAQPSPGPPCSPLHQTCTPGVGPDAGRHKPAVTHDSPRTSAALHQVGGAEPGLFASVSS